MAGVFGFWPLVTMLACLCALFVGVTALAGSTYKPTWWVHVHAAGALLTYMSVLQFFESTPVD